MLYTINKNKKMTKKLTEFYISGRKKKEVFNSGLLARGLS
jgi:hypothetical protein